MDLKNNSILIQHLKKGDEKAYSFLLDTYHKKLYVYALSLIDDHSMAEDIVQEVFLKTWQFRKRLNPKFTIQSFLYKSVYHQFINKYKQNQALSLLEEQYVRSLDKIIENYDDNTMAQKVKWLNQTITTLPKKQQKIFNLSKKEGLTNQEISDYLNISIKTVEGHIAKAYKLLRKKLSQRLIPINRKK